MKVLYVGLRDHRHSSAGGYDWISKCPGTDTLWDYQAPFAFLKPHQRGKRINLFFQDLKARRLARKYDVLHYFYGDNLKRGFGSRRSYKTVATIHMDLTQNKNLDKFVKILNSLDGVITLSSSQKNILTSLGIHAMYIPHGFNEPQFDFVDMNIDNSKINIVISGSNYRDVETMIYAIDYCADFRKDIKFHLLGQPVEVKRVISTKSNAVCYPRLDDDQYFSLMASCDYSFLPLTFATANNALLEAQYLGIKGILPQIDGISDYAAPQPLNSFYSSRQELTLYLSRIEKCNRSEQLKNFALKFRWEVIYMQLKEYYSNLLIY